MKKTCLLTMSIFALLAASCGGAASSSENTDKANSTTPAENTSQTSSATSKEEPSPEAESSSNEEPSSKEESSISVAATFAVSLDASQVGKVSVSFSKTEAEEGETIIATVTKDPSFVVNGLVAEGINFTKGEEDEAKVAYSFAMPSHAVTVSVNLSYNRKITAKHVLSSSSYSRYFTDIKVDTDAYYVPGETYTFALEVIDDEYVGNYPEQWFVTLSNGDVFLPTASKTHTNGNFTYIDEATVDVVMPDEDVELFLFDPSSNFYSREGGKVHAYVDPGVLLLDYDPNAVYSGFAPYLYVPGDYALSAKWRYTGSGDEFTEISFIADYQTGKVISDNRLAYAYAFYFNADVDLYITATPVTARKITYVGADKVESNDYYGNALPTSSLPGDKVSGSAKTIDLNDYIKDISINTASGESVYNESYTKGSFSFTMPDEDIVITFDVRSDAIPVRYVVDDKIVAPTGIGRSYGDSMQYPSIRRSRLV